ncbi:MAG: monooxygenase family protein [Actinomycetota bacterium]
MAYRSARKTVDLSAYPDLVVILLGMRAKSLRGHLTLLSFRGPITRAVKARPDGLLAHEWMTMTLLPLHVGMRQYWRDFESLERWARTDARHSQWWKSFAENPRGTTFWHETYLRQGGIELVHGNPDPPGHTFGAPLLTGQRQGLYSFAPSTDAVGSMVSARRRLQREGEPTAEVPVEP